MDSKDYWKEKTVSWKSVGTGYSIAIFLIAGMLLAEAITYGITQFERPESSVAITASRDKVSRGIEPDRYTKMTADLVAVVDSLTDKERFLFNCPLCE